MADGFGIRNPRRYANINRPFATQFLNLAGQTGAGAPVSPSLLPLRQAVLQQQMRPQGTAAQQMMALPTRLNQELPKRPQTLNERISGMMPKAGTPQAAGLSAAGAKMLQLSGYHDVPVPMSQILGEAAQAYSTAKKETAKEQREEAALKVAAERQATLDQMAAEMHRAKIAELRATKPPTLVTLYTPEGGSYKAYYDPADPSADDSGYVRVGGIKPPSGMSVSVDPETGQVTFAQGVGAGAMEKTTKKDLEKDVGVLTNRLGQLDQISRDFDPSFLQIPTQIEMAGYQLGERLNLFDLPEDVRKKMLSYSSFRARTQEIFSGLLRELSGAAVTSFELDNARTFIPSKEDSPSAFQAKLRGFKATTSAALFRAQNLLSGKDAITDNLAKKYPLSITKSTEGDGERTIFINEYVDLAMQLNEGLTQAQALDMYAEEAKGGR
jgi:flagellar basal body rod protein FlgC